MRMISLFILLLSTLGAKAADESKAIRFVLDAGGYIEGGSPVTKVTLCFKQSITDESLKELAGFPKLRDLYLNGAVITDKGLKELARLKTLRLIYLIGTTRLTDAGLKELAPLQDLETLNLDEVTNITDAGMKELAKLPKLQTLGVERD